MALAANLARDPRKTKEFKPSDFNPYAGAAAKKSAGRPAVKLKPEESVRAIASVFCDHKLPPLPHASKRT